MRIWMHQLLSVIGWLGGFLGGGLVFGALLELIRDLPRWIVIPVGTAAFIGLAYGGLRLGEWLIRRLPARCPNCGGRTYAEGHRPIRFRCRDCEHVHRTRTRANWGQD